VKRRKAVVLSVVSGIAASLLCVLPAQAAGTAIQVRPEMPSQQRSSTSSYFDVVLAPGESTLLKVEVSNSSSETVSVDADVAPAQTSDGGAITYESTIAHAGMPTVNMANLVSQKHQELSIPAGSTVTYSTTLTMPSSSVEGVVAGGISFEQKDQGSSDSSASDNVGMGITSKYRYVVAALVRNQETTVHPKLAFGEITAKQKDYQNSIALLINNTAPTYLNQLEVDTTAQLRGSDAKYTRSASMMQMAPTSAFTYAISLPDDVKAGTYDVTATAYYVKDSGGKYKDASGQKYRYRVTHSGSVTITDKKAKDMVNTIKKVRNVQTGLAWWVYVIIGVFLLLLILLLILYYAYRKNKKETERLRAQTVAGVNTVDAEEVSEGVVESRQDLRRNESGRHKR
jgi:hypothetical protein